MLIVNDAEQSGTQKLFAIARRHVACGGYLLKLCVLWQAAAAVTFCRNYPLNKSR